MCEVYKNQYGWLIDQKTFLDSNINMNICNMMKNHQSCYRIRHDLFAIYNTFQMDSQFLKNSRNSTDLNSSEIDSLPTDSPPKRSDRKKKATKRLAPSPNNDALLKILSEAHTSIQEGGVTCGYFLPLDAATLDNNLAARSIAKRCSSISILDLLPSQPAESSVVFSIIGEACIVSPSDVANRLVATEARGSHCVMTMGGQSFVLPDASTFLWSDIQHVHLLIQSHVHYDLIILDPPWQNKSVKRKKSYRCLDDADLLSLPVPQLAAPGAIIATWVTNKAQHLDFVTDELFPHWLVSHCATWRWLKVTRCGELVTPLDSDHKKPYETILIGQYRPDGSDIPRLDIPDNRVVMSVPASVHSQKPCLHEVLRDYLPTNQNHRCIELFARNLLSGWTSWGNEVFKHQHSSLFQESEAFNFNSYHIT